MSRRRTCQLRRLFRVVNGGTPTSDAENWEGPIPWATPVDLAGRNGGQIGSTERTLTDQGLRTGSTLVPPGSLVLSTRAPIGYVAETAVAMAFNQGCRGLIPVVDLDSRFYRYSLESLVPLLQSRGQGSTFSELSGDGLAEVRLPTVGRREQGAVADFLDTETARIDALITKKRRMIDLLRERADGAVELAMRRMVADDGEVPLKRRVAEVTVGIVVTPAEWYADQGVIALRGLNVRTRSDRHHRRGKAHERGPPTAREVGPAPG